MSTPHAFIGILVIIYILELLVLRIVGIILLDWSLVSLLSRAKNKNKDGGYDHSCCKIHHQNARKRVFARGALHRLTFLSVYNLSYLD